MSKRLKLLMVAVVAVLVWWLSVEPEVSITVQDKPQKQLVENEKRENDTKEVTQILLKKSTREEVLETSTQLHQATQIVATQYEKAIQYPPYSQPLTEHDLDRLEPNFFYPVSSATQDGTEPLTIKLSKYRFVYPEDIKVEVTGGDFKRIELQLVDVELNKEYSQSNIRAGQSVTFQGSKEYARSMQLIAIGVADGKRVPVVAQFQYMQPSAKIIALSNAYPQNDNLQVDVTLDVSNPGLYRVRANLLTQSNRPLAHLVSKQKLSKGIQVMQLRAHWSVLEPQLSDMRLAGFVVERTSPTPGEPALFGDSELAYFDIFDFPYDSLQQLSYQPSQNELQKAQFLRQLSNPEKG